MSGVASWLVPEDGRELVLMVDDKTYATITRWSDSKSGRHAWFGIERFSDGRSLGVLVRFDEACKAATDDAGVSLAPPADLAAEWADIVPEDGKAAAPIRAAPKAGLKIGDFARHCAGLSAISSKWASDVLCTARSGDLEERPETVRRFIDEMREHLNYIEEKLNG